MIRTAAVLALGLLACAPAHAASSDDPDGALTDLFAIWSDNSRITPDRVARLYGPSVDYYGHVMTPAGVYNDKRALVRRWPSRSYAVVPGSVEKGCDPDKTRCSVRLLMSWTVSKNGRSHAAHGQSTLRLVLARQGSDLKIIRESGGPVRRTGR